MVKSELTAPIKQFKPGCKKFLTAFTVDSESEDKEEKEDNKDENTNLDIIKGKKTQLRNRKKVQTIANICQDLEGQLSSELRSTDIDQAVQILKNRELDNLVECI